MRWKALVVVASLALALPALASASDQGTNAVVQVGAHTSFDRTYNWLVTKTDDHHGSITLAQNSAASIGYTVTVSNGTPAYTNSNWQVQDGITIASSDPFVLDNANSLSVSATQGATTTGGGVQFCSYDSLYTPTVPFPIAYTPGGRSLLCHYVVALPNGDPGVVNIGATFGDGSASSGQVAFDFSPSGDLDGAQPTIYNNGPLSVVDSLGGVLGQVSAPVDALHPATFRYSVPVPSSTCGTSDLPNKVNLVDGSGRIVATASDTVHVTVTCDHTQGCKYTQGYWKTHSTFGPAPKPDPTWTLVGGPNAAFYLSGQSWLAVFNTPPAGGNVYYDLAHQYEAAILNQAGGAPSTGAVDLALAFAKGFFRTYTPASAGALPKNSIVRALAIAAAATLDNYNNG